MFSAAAYPLNHFWIARALALFDSCNAITVRGGTSRGLQLIQVSLVTDGAEPGNLTFPRT